MPPLLDQRGRGLDLLDLVVRVHQAMDHLPVHGHIRVPGLGGLLVDVLVVKDFWSQILLRKGRHGVQVQKALQNKGLRFKTMHKTTKEFDSEDKGTYVGGRIAGGVRCHVRHSVEPVALLGQVLH